MLYQLSIRGSDAYYSLSYPTVILTFLLYTLFPQMRQWRPGQSGTSLSSGMEKMPFQNMPVQRLKVAFLLLDLPWFGLITHSREIQTTDKSHKKKPDVLFPKDDLEMRKVLWFKYVTWNGRGLGEKEEELDKTLNESNIKISAITESKKKLQGTEKTENYMVIYIGANRYTRGQLGVMIWTNTSISNKIEYYKFWNDRIIETRLKIKEVLPR